MIKYKTIHRFRASYYFVIFAILFTLASVKAFSFFEGSFCPPDLAPSIHIHHSITDPLHKGGMVYQEPESTFKDALNGYGSKPFTIYS